MAASCPKRAAAEGRQGTARPRKRSNAGRLPVGLAGGATRARRTREIVVVGRVGEELRLEADAGIRAVAPAAEARHGDVDVGAVVELDARLGRPDVEGDAALVRFEAGLVARLGRLRRRDDQVDVVGEALAVVHQADRRERAAVVAGAVNRPDLSGGDEVLVGRGVGVGVDRDAVVEDVGRVVEVEVAVLGEIGDRRRIGGRLGVEAERRRRLDRVAAGRLELAGIALVAVRAGERERDAGGVEGDDPPVSPAEAVRARRGAGCGRARSRRAR